MKVTVVNKYKYSGHMTYIGRGSVFGNPWPIDRDNTRDDVCDKYETYFKEQMKDPLSPMSIEVQKLMRSKTDIVLACFCKPHRCHGDTIKRHIDMWLLKRRNTK